MIEGLPSYQQFCGKNLTRTIADAETALRGKSGELRALIDSLGATQEVMTAASELKRIAGQVNVVIHAAGILRCLPHILDPDERVEYVSLGAGNTGRTFDLETDRRVAEFKFITWKGADTIRQNSLFKDFFLLAEHPTQKRKQLFLLEKDRPLRFLNGKRALSSVLKDKSLAENFNSKFDSQYRTVRDYFVPRKDIVTLEDVSEWLPVLAEG